MTIETSPYGTPVIEESCVADRDPLRRPVIMHNLEMVGIRYAYEITREDMECIRKRDRKQHKLGRPEFRRLLPEVSSANSVGYFYNGKHIYFELSIRHDTYECLQEVIDHVTMYIEGLDCHWITGAMD